MNILGDLTFGILKTNFTKLDKISKSRRKTALQLIVQRVPLLEQMN